MQDSEILVGQICLGNISKDWSVDNMKKTGFTGYVYDFSVDYDPIAVDDIKNIQKYLIKKIIQYDKYLSKKTLVAKQRIKNVCIY